MENKCKSIVFILSERKNNHKSYFYYPDKACKTIDGGIKMLMDSINSLDNFEKNYTLDMKLEELQ